MTIKDFFSHLDETLDFNVQLLDDGTPIDLSDHNVQLAVATEIDRPTIVEYSLSANTGNITVVNANVAIINVQFTPTANTGFRANTQVYQLRTVETATSKTKVVLEGKIYLTDSLFD